MATFLGTLIVDFTKNESSPIWGDAAGITIGCLLGILVPKLILGNSSETHGANKASVKFIFLGDMNKEEVQLLLDDLSLLTYKSRVIFNKLDENKSGTLDYNEIQTYMERSLGDEYDEATFNEYITKYFNFEVEGKTKEFNIDEFEKI